MFYEGPSSGDFSLSWQNVIVGWDGYVYIQNYDNTIGRFDNDGTQIDIVEQLRLGMLVAVDSAGYMYFFSEPNLLKVDQSGEIIWIRELPMGLFDGPTAIDREGAYYYPEYDETADAARLIRCGD
jgi:hypothetical protein